MVIDTERALAMRCPACGKLNHQVFSLFAFSGNRAVKLQCTCGFTLLILSTRDHKRYTIQSFCVVCEAPHLTNVQAKELWCQESTELVCPETNVELGILGSRALVREAVRKEQTPLEDVLSSAEHDDFFENKEIMTEVLYFLQELASQSRLYCQCGNANIDIDIYPERVELHCPECDGSLTVYGRSVDDLQLLETVSEIVLAKENFQSKDGEKFKTHK
ncbi:MAG: hypothetical protein H0Z38_00870 [Firmicutes bacterium]|nr:hypothetical protein [Bacillota bacterium]